MVALLDAPGTIVDAAKSVAQSPAGSTLTMLGTVVGGLVTALKIMRWFEERRTARAWKKIGPVAPREQESPESAQAREELLQGAARAERESALGRTLWRLEDTEARLREASVELTRLRNALTRERAVREEQRRMLNDLRADNEALRADLERVRGELDAYQHVGELELEPVTEERAGELPTPMRPPRPPRRTA